MQTVQSRLKEAYITVTCPHCRTQVEYLNPTPTESTLKDGFNLACAKCNQTWIIKPGASSSSSSSSAHKSGKEKAKRRIGTDERPLDMTYYERLGLPVTCTTEDVKKAYRRLAIKFHPDKNPDDPSAAERFKEIAIAYTTLSDPGLRHAYNEFGKGKGDGGGQDGEAMVDPEAIFSQLFGGERFQDIIGTISLGQDMKAAMQDEDEEEVDTTPKTHDPSQPPPPTPSPEEIEAKRKKKEAKAEAEKKVAEHKEKARQERVKNLVERLKTKLALFSEQAQGEEDEQIASGVRTMWTIEAEELKQESYGVELLHTVGFVYKSKSQHYLATTGIIPFGVAGWFHSARSTAHIIGQTVSTVRSAYALKDVFEAISQAEKSGLSDEKKKELEDKAAQMGLHALFKGAKLEVESVIREVCDTVLAEEGVPMAMLRKRAVAVGILGEVYESVKKDAHSNPPIRGGAPFANLGGVPPPAARGD
ncbi:BQ5605_C002g01751 [Microbotryum silenes-dioicae]|uniref:BQ5605_C002g01751 protein n=1 Tax=Microbotryum silenes-dioicae TaxID=796604 RepID=A0A2X0M3R1_9BASI|nr:BQ5605_C002g01751 [Microbotryum silenes-dioicae]